MHLKDKLRNWITLIDAGGSPHLPTKTIFMEMAQQSYGERAARLTWGQIMQLAGSHGVCVPAAIRRSRDLMLDADHWDLSRKEEP